MRFVFESESRPKGPGGNHGFNFSLKFKDERLLVCAGAFPTDCTADIVRHFAVELEHYAQVHAEKAWPSASSETILLELTGEAGRLLSDPEGDETCKVNYFAALLRNGEVSYLSMGDACAAIWNTILAGTGDSETANSGGIHFLNSGDAKAGASRPLLEPNQKPTASDIQQAPLPLGSAFFLSPGGVLNREGQHSEKDMKLLAAAIEEAYGEQKSPARRLLDGMLGQWDRSEDFTGLVIEALPEEDGRAKSVEKQTAKAAKEANRFHNTIQDLMKRLEDEIVRAEEGFEQAVTRGETVNKDPESGEEVAAEALSGEGGKEIMDAAEAMRRTLKEAIDDFEARAGRALSEISPFISGLDEKFKNIETLERKLEAVIEEGLGRLNQRPDQNEHPEHGRLPGIMVLALLLLFMLLGGGAGFYGYKVFLEVMGEESMNPDSGGVPGAAKSTPFYAGKVLESIMPPAEETMVLLNVEGSDLTLPVHREIYQKRIKDPAEAVSMDQAYELMLDTLRLEGYGKQETKNAISFLMDARSMDASRRLELLNLMAFNYLYAENGISSYEDRSWAVNVFVDRFPLENFSNPEHAGGEPGVLEIKLDDETFNKLARWKEGVEAPQEEAVPIILQFMFVYGDSKDGPALIDGKWGPKSESGWGEYLENLRLKGMPDAESWAGKDPLQPIKGAAATN